MTVGTLEEACEAARRAVTILGNAQDRAVPIRDALCDGQTTSMAQWEYDSLVAGVAQVKADLDDAIANGYIALT